MSRQPKKIQPASGIHTWLVLWKAFNAVREYATHDIASQGLSLTDFGILEALLHKGPSPVTDLGRTVSLTSGSITSAVDRLQTRGLVERQNQDEDRRTRVVHLTRAGRKQIEDAFRKHAASMDGLGSVLTDRERAELVRLLKKLGYAAVIGLVHQPPEVERTGGR
jgi:MarR family 2-MHQ and catechol resistance regulon transcriptional repressor